MIANYHTHTWRCMHADYHEREYIERAIEGGLKILGFADHTPSITKVQRRSTRKKYVNKYGLNLIETVELRKPY